MKILVSEHIWDFDLREALEEISAQRREQALKFKYELGQRLCVRAYQLLKQALNEEYGIAENPVFAYNVHGKPSIEGHPEIYFNLSHCKEAVACIVSDHPVGIDVETLRSYKDSLVHYTMSDEEIRQIETAERPEVAFIRLWTMKEATLKLIGTGISDDLKTVINHQLYRYTTVERAQYIYTVCENKVHAQLASEHVPLSGQ